eukprot:Skav212739  [mRNA]  locus=scaffold1199:64324:65402:+ [translate_table: standard]
MCAIQSTKRACDFKGRLNYHQREALLTSAEADSPARLRRAVQQGNVGSVRRFIRDKKAEFLNIVSSLSNLIPMALQSKRSLEMLKLLIQGWTESFALRN